MKDHGRPDEGMEGLSERDILERCNHECGDRSCNRLKPEDFLNHDACHRNGFHRLWIGLIPRNFKNSYLKMTI